MQDLMQDLHVGQLQESTWRAALSGPALDLLSAPAALDLARATSAIAQATFGCHGPGAATDTLVPLVPDTLARVTDFLERMLQNDLGTFILSTSTVRSVRNMCHGEKAGRGDAEKLLLSVLLRMTCSPLFQLQCCQTGCYQ